ncbi:MAG: DUF3090 domain-containing protein [Anaerolineaceae bacterium]
MPGIQIDIHPASHVTTDAIGKPGERVFYLQATQPESAVTTLLIEKAQLQSLVTGIQQFMDEIHQEYQNIPADSAEFDEDAMRIQTPVDPLFRVGEIGLGYDFSEDLIVLLARESQLEGQTVEDLSVVRVWCTRSQIRALGAWSIMLITRGRPLCPQCGEPMDPEGHFCPKKNGHKH